MIDRQHGRMTVYGCCEHCEDHDPGYPHTEPCEDERCDGAEPLRLAEDGQDECPWRPLGSSSRSCLTRDVPLMMEHRAWHAARGEFHVSELAGSKMA
jgi:hypothetical protein